MSLKAFHIFFIGISVILFAGIGVQCLRAFFEHHAVLQLGLSILSFGAAVALVLYGRLFLAKLKDVGYL